MTKILFVSNDGSRTGAPAILLGLIQWLAAHKSVQPVTVLMRDGALREEFEQTGNTYTWNPPDLNKPERFHKRLGKLLLQRGNADPGAWLTALIEKEQPDILYLSTLVLGKYLGRLSVRPGCHVVTHVHELLPSLRQLSSDDNVRTQLNLSDKVISCATCVQDTLIKVYGLPAHKCSIIPEFISIPTFDKGSPDPAAPAAPGQSQPLLRLQDAIARGVHVFGIGGNPIARKGFDLIPLFIKECKLLFGDQPFLVVWIGCGEHSAAHVAIDWDLSQMGLSQHLMLVPSVAMPQFRQLVSQLSVLTLLSREDPFPLVVLEAGLLGIPTVCFAGSGAIPEMADQGCCIRVGYLDLPAFATAVYELCHNPEAASAIGERCRQKVSHDLTINTVAPQVAAVLLEGRQASC